MENGTTKTGLKPYPGSSKVRPSFAFVEGSMVTATVPSSLKRRLDMAIDHLLSQGHFDLAVRLTQGDENELCLVTVEDIDAGTSDADNILKDGKYRGFPRSVTDGLRSYVEYGERLFGRGQKAFVEHGANRKTSSTF